MLPFVFFGLFALAQCAPSQSMPALVSRQRLNPGLARDLATAREFAKSVKGPSDVVANWTNSGDDLCSWNGFFCEVNPATNANALASVDFNGLQLTGNLKLGGFLDKFTDLAIFHVNSNGFTGSVPNLAGLKYLYELDFSNNKLSGTFPRNVLSASGLKYLDLRYNNFEGVVPGEVFTKFNSIEALFLNNNQFKGKLPDTIGSFRGNYLVLAYNQFQGPIPTSLTGATALIEVNVSNNQLSGSIPSGLGAISKLDSFDASHNQLSGKVPEDLCAIKTLKNLDLSGNQLIKDLGPKCRNLQKAGILKI